ncbi:MAG TPA: SBBP repeat-containing protein [Verrucomicrobiae bacterium]|nr:SBBP repeat-containing protein [Verrucomicrobiae bacterium]
MRRSPALLILAAGVSAALSARASTAPGIIERYGHLPLSFEVNSGQTDDRAGFVSRGQGYTLYLTPTEAVLTLCKDEGRPRPAEFRYTRSMSPASPAAELVRMRLLGANPQAPAASMDPLPGRVNYFVGDDPTGWKLAIPLYGRAVFHRVYPGVDLTYHGQQGQLEYDFTVAPGTDSHVITLVFDGSRGTRINPDGELVLRTTGGEVRFRAPHAYQLHGGRQQAVASRYVMMGNDRVGFRVASYDRRRPLVIDPVLVYSTYLGGSGYYGDYGNGITVDSAGNAYIIGGTGSANFPTTNAFQSAKGNPSIAAFVTELGPGGSNLVFSTYLGGNNRDCGTGIAVDPTGNVYVAGWTLSTNFPTRNAVQPAIGGGTNAFVAKLGPGGSNLIYSTFLGGNGGYLNDWANALAIDSAGNAYVTGSTTSTNFPIRNAFQSTLGSAAGNAFVTKLGGPGGSNLVYSTYLGGNGINGDFGYGIAVDADGSAYIAGLTTSTNFPTQNAFQSTLNSAAGNGFVTKLGGAGGSNLVYSTYLGGDTYEQAMAVAVDAASNAYVTGWTRSTNFPTRNAFQTALAGEENAFVTKFEASGSNLIYSTYLGGAGRDGCYGIRVDAATNAYVVGDTTSANFPTRSAFQTALAGEVNAFVTEVDASGSNLAYSTYLGGNGVDQGFAIAMDAAGNAYVTGETTSSNFPTTNAFQATLRSSSGNAFVTKIGGLGSALRIVGITMETNDVRITWTTAGGESYTLQTNAPSANGSYSNLFSDLSAVITAPGRGVSTTNYIDIGGATNGPARYYRVRVATR